MAERPQLANVTVSYEMHADPRFRCLAELGGWSHGDACWRMVVLWARCTALATDQPGERELRVHLGPRAAEILVEALLAELLPGGAIRVLGGGLTGGDTDRFSWFAPIEVRNRAGGRARADQVRREGRAASGRFAAAGTSVHQQPTSNPTSVTSDPPASASNPPASGFRIPDQIPEVSHPRDPAVPGTTPATAPGIPDRTAVREAIRGELQAARTRAGAARKVEIKPLLAFDRGIDSDLTGRLALCVTFAALELLAGQARHAIAMAELEVTHGAKSFEWFTGAIFSGGAFSRLAGMTREDAMRERPPPRGSAGRAKSIHVGRVEPRPSHEYTEEGDQEI